MGALRQREGQGSGSARAVGELGPWQRYGCGITKAGGGEGQENTRAVGSLRWQEGQGRGVLGLWECYSSMRAKAAGAQGQEERYGLGAQGQRES